MNNDSFSNRGGTPDIPVSWDPYRRRVFWGMTGCLIAGAALITPFDIAVSERLNPHGVPGDVRRILGLSEFFAHGFGVVMILIAIAVLAPSLRRALPRVALCAALPGLLVNLIKLAVGRFRPETYHQWLASQPVDLTPSVEQTWIGWFVGWDANSVYEFGYAIQSFPSGHAATAVGLAVGLTWLFPRGTKLFFVMAVMASLQRIVFQAHWSSDVLVGAALGWIIARGFLCHSARVDRWFARWERPAADAIRAQQANGTKEL